MDGNISACTLWSLYLHFQLFLHFCALVKQSQILPSLSVWCEKPGEQCSHLPDGCYRAASEGKNAPTGESENYMNTEREALVDKKPCVRSS